MMKTENDFLGALMGAAILNEAAKKAQEPAATTETDKYTKAAHELRKYYEAFLKVGFTEDQATQFIAAILH